MKRLPALLLLLSSLSVPASAATLTYVASGVVTSVDPAFSSVAVGDPYSLTIVIDSATPDSDATPGVGYYVPDSYALSIGSGYSASGAGSSLVAYRISISSPVRIAFENLSQPLTGLEGESFFSGVLLRLQDQDGIHPLIDDSLVLPIDLTPFEQRPFAIAFGSAGQFVIAGNVGSATIVPEPSLAALLLAVGIALSGGSWARLQ